MQILAEQIEGLAAMLMKATGNGALPAEMRDRVDRLTKYVFGVFEEYILIYIPVHGYQRRKKCALSFPGSISPASCIMILMPEPSLVTYLP